MPGIWQWCALARPTHAHVVAMDSPLTVTALREEMIDRFERVERRCDAIERRIDDGAMAVSNQFAELRAYTEFGYERLDKALNGLSGGIARLERKLDRILALSVESRGRRA
jgi:hypothetical protein